MVGIGPKNQNRLIEEVQRRLIDTNRIKKILKYFKNKGSVLATDHYSSCIMQYTWRIVSMIEIVETVKLWPSLLEIHFKFH